MRIMVEAEKESYLQVMISLASSDGSISLPEANAIRIIAKNLGIIDARVDVLLEEVKSGKLLSEILKGITSRNIKLLLIYELVTLSYIDGNYSTNEQTAMKEITRLLDIEECKLIEIEELILDYIAFQKKISTVLEDETNE
jgi:uncharacterized tellurite resistance protein B-like protein